MIRTDPPLDEIEKYYEEYQRLLVELQKSIKGFSTDTSLDTHTRLLFIGLDVVVSFLHNQAGMNVGNIRVIKKLSELIDQRAGKEEVKEKIEIIEKRVIDTLIPMSELIKKTKEIQEKSADYIG